MRQITLTDKQYMILKDLLYSGIKQGYRKAIGATPFCVFAQVLMNEKSFNELKKIQKEI